MHACTCICDAAIIIYIVIEIAVRLAGGNSYNEGRVEVNYNGEWGTVCDDGWDDIDVGVVCRQLGFGSLGTKVTGKNEFGEGPGPVWLDDVSCTGRELTLVSCGHLGVGILRQCFSFELNAGVKCLTDRVKGNLLFVCNFATKFCLRTTMVGHQLIDLLCNYYGSYCYKGNYC